MINKIELKNFTVFEDITIEFCKGVNVFIGENGTGKTHLLKLLYFDSKMETKVSSFFNCEYACLVKETSKNKGKLTINKEVENSNGEHKNVIFIPAKEMLSHSKGLLTMSKKYSKDMPFDKTLLDIIEKAQAWKVDEITSLTKDIVPKLEKVIAGKVFMRDDSSFWVRKNDGLEIPFSLEAEGLRKFGLLWQLLMNESITKDTILIWDEPEANLNPQLLPVLVDILLELSLNGVQVFLATHNGNLCEYFDIKRAESGDVMFHFLNKSDNSVKCHSTEKYSGVDGNPIELASEKLYEDTLDSAFGEVQEDE